MSKTFDMTKEIEECGRNVRGSLIWVYPSELRTILEKTVDLQVETSKFINKTAIDMFNKMVPASSK
jgi:hypothetical protein